MKSNLKFLVGNETDLPNSKEDNTFYYAVDTNRFFLGNEELVTKSYINGVLTNITEQLNSISTQLSSITN